MGGSVKAITAGEIYNKILNKENLFILDVRNNSEYEDWKIEGKTVESINTPYFELLDGLEEVMPKISADKELLVVCAKEGSSKYIANMISEEGLDAKYLSGGMKTWSEYLHKTIIYEEENLKIAQFIRVGKGCLSYMITSGDEVVVIDPARFTNVYAREAVTDDVTIKHVLDTHCHADHVSGGLNLATATNANYYMMQADGAESNYTPLENIESIEFGQSNLKILTLKTPGHTPGSICFLLNDKYLFSGDTIFVNGLGRPDLGGMAEVWAKDLYNSVVTKINGLSNNVIVLPSHCAEVHNDINESNYIGTTLGNIRAISPLLNMSDESQFISTVLKNINKKQPPNFVDIIAANRGTKEFTDEQVEEFEIGPNRCALQH